MDYFLLKQAEEYTNVPMLLDVYKKIDVRNINLVKAHKLEEIIIFNVKCTEDTEFLDILDRNLFLISENMKKIIGKYDPGIIFKTIPLIDLENGKQGNYYLPIFQEVECLSEKAELNLNKTVVKKIILDKNKINGKKIFKIKESEKTLIVVRLDVAESLLRREFKGISLERLEVEA
ncbi:imm11 family protein [Clostridium saccharoperbutylacetonicum]|uniref:imm11 family protein n=1 Tax=Clostridium saccharoperbutylacetonicum TaxID=36745 RepID=UPI0039ED08E0